MAAELNRLFPFDPATAQFSTLVYGILDVTTGEFRYVSAGHPGAVHWPLGGDSVILESPGFPIGLAEDDYEERSLRLAPGDRLYLYSDGVVEAMNVDGQQFGESRLLQVIAQGRLEPLHDSAAAILSIISRWNASESPQDDISILVVEFLGATGSGGAGCGLDASERLIANTQ